MACVLTCIYRFASCDLYARVQILRKPICMWHCTHAQLKKKKEASEHSRDSGKERYFPNPRCFCTCVWEWVCVCKCVRVWIWVFALEHVCTGTACFALFVYIRLCRSSFRPIKTRLRGNILAPAKWWLVQKFSRQSINVRYNPLPLAIYTICSPTNSMLQSVYTCSFGARRWSGGAGFGRKHKKELTLHFSDERSVYSSMVRT